MSEAVLGIVGLGRMGGPMAGRLVAAGYTVVGFDVAGTEGRLPDGAVAATSVVDLAARSDTILLSVPDGVASLAVCRQVAEAAARRVRAVVDLSTIGIAAARACATVLDEAAITYVDAPVSGGVAGARDGTLAMMVGAQSDV